jgi:hypothetical protein
MKSNPVERTQNVLKDNKNSPTYGALERDQHIILEDNNGIHSIAMPVYFIYIYNRTLKLAVIILADTFKQVQTVIWNGNIGNPSLHILRCLKLIFLWHQE